MEINELYSFACNELENNLGLKSTKFLCNLNQFFPCRTRFKKV